MCVNDYGIKRKVISTRNPQANAIVERAHQMLGNLIRSFQLQDKPYYDLDDPWGGILTAVAFTLRSTYHTTLQAMPGQLLSRIPSQKVCNITSRWLTLFLFLMEIGQCPPWFYGNQTFPKYEQPYSGPYPITQVNTNGTVHLKINAVTDTVNIWCFHPLKTPNSNCGGECSMQCHRAKDRWEHVN
jgi:hypothetical protein